jgi:hypothetical protein
MSKRMFRVTLAVDIAIEEALVAAVLDPAWRARFASSIRTPEDVAKHLARHIAQGQLVCDIAGFQTWPPDAAIISNIESKTAVELRKGTRHS